MTDEKLHKAVRDGRLSEVKILLDAGADINAVYSRWLMTPLHAAIEERYEPMVKLLLDRNANVNVSDFERNTPLHGAACWGCVPVVSRLLQLDADINAVDKWLMTPLHYAIVRQNVSVVNLLLDLLPNVNVASDDNETPLHGAARWGCVPVIERLLQVGADIHAISRDSKTPLHVAIDEYRYMLVNPLFRHNRSAISVLLEHGGASYPTCCRLIDEIRSPRDFSPNASLALLDLTVQNLWDQINNKVNRCQCFNYLVGEIEGMKATSVGGVTLDQLTTQSIHKLVRLTKNSKVVKAVSSVNFTVEFPIFGDLLLQKWKSIMTRSPLVFQGSSALFSMMPKSIHQAWNDVADYIIRLLSDDDLFNLIAAAQLSV